MNTETMTKHSETAFDYLTVKNCGYRLVAMPSGGKNGPPSLAVFALYCDQFNEDGTRNGEQVIGLLEDTEGRVVTAAWASAAGRRGTARTWGRIEPLAYAQFGNRLQEGKGIPDAARRPIEVASLIKETREFYARMRKVSPMKIGIEEVVTQAKACRPDLAPWIKEDGSYNPAPKKTAAKRSAKK